MSELSCCTLDLRSANVYAVNLGASPHLSRQNKGNIASERSFPSRTPQQLPGSLHPSQAPQTPPSPLSSRSEAEGSAFSGTFVEIFFGRANSGGTCVFPHRPSKTPEVSLLSRSKCRIGNCCPIAMFRYDECGSAGRSREPRRLNSRESDRRNTCDDSIPLLARGILQQGQTYPASDTLRQFTCLGAIQEPPEFSHPRLEQDHCRLQVHADTAGCRQPHVALRSTHARWRFPGA